jgi:uncharacterized membrane protein
MVLNLAAGAFGLAMMNRLPVRVASHWDLHGAVNGYSSRLALVLLVPLMSVVMAVVLAYVPQLDPKRRNFPLHAGAYWVVTNVILGFLALVHVVLIGINLGWQINLEAVLGLGLGILFIVLGNVLTRVRPNWIFGVRTPWTLSSDLSWRETHRIAGYGFVAAGLVVLITAFAAPKAVFVVMMVGVGSTAVVAVTWSYFAWKRDPAAQGRDA